MLKNLLNIQMSTLMTLYMDNYSYNGLEINVKNNLIIDQKYNNNLYILPTNNKNVFIIIKGNGYVKTNKEDDRKKLSSSISEKFKKPE